MNRILTMLLVLCFYNLRAQNNELSNQGVEQLIDSFKESIVNKDSITFNELFFDHEISFTGIMSEKTEHSIKKDYPEFQGIAVSNHKEFIRSIVKSDKNQEERFYNVEVKEDGVVGIISFDYSFISESNMIQWGREHWNIVYAEGKWMITNVVYSIHFPDIEAFPYQDQKDE